MDNLTHSLVGLAAAKAGLGRLSPYATLVCVAAANLPDADIVALAGGPSYYLANHRGITHSIVGTFALGVAFPALFYAVERLWARARGREPRARLKGLMLCSLLLVASHPLLDWTNSYGVRPLLPWDGRWIYGDILFVVDPWIWLVTGGACFLLTARTGLRAAAWALLAAVTTTLFFLFAGRGSAGVPPAAYVFWLAGLGLFAALHVRGAGARFGPKAALAALAFVVVYCGALAFLHARAREGAEQFAREISSGGGERLTRVAATPLPVDPLAWRCLAETDRSTFRFDVTLGVGGESGEGPRNFIAESKPSGEAAAVAARASDDPRARVLLDFARFPVTLVRGDEAGGWVVRIADLRFTEPRAPSGSFVLDVTVK
ncbi:MAG TPA: metal-dependent hydrolase [Pyrinomonadaceae bacterium]|nr:metal-dependent hydrolase [Pyrinomonadaceae bacterium]